MAVEYIRKSWADLVVTDINWLTKMLTQTRLDYDSRASSIAPSVVKDLDALEDTSLRFVAYGITLAMDQFGSQRCEKALIDCIAQQSPLQLMLGATDLLIRLYLITI